jgi:hypothetical protein
MSTNGGKTVLGTVRDTGRNYADGSLCLEIHIPIGSTGALPLQIGKRVTVRLRIGKGEVLAGLRATEKNKYAWISPDVQLSGEGRRTLGSVLEDAGFSPNDPVQLTIGDDSITLEHERPELSHLPALPTAYRPRLELEEVHVRSEPPQSDALEKFGGLTKYRLEDEHSSEFRTQFELVRRGLVLSSLAADADADPALSALTGVRGVYFVTMRLGGSEYKIYVGKTTSLPRRLADYRKAFQVHSPNDFKLRVLQDYMWQRFPQAAFDLYFARESELGYTSDETAALRRHSPLVNERATKSVDAIFVMQQAFEAHYAAVFGQKIGQA